MLFIVSSELPNAKVVVHYNLWATSAIRPELLPIVAEKSDIRVGND
jgi:hypothetical protein